MNIIKNQEHRKRYVLRKRAGICVRCGTKKARPNLTLCEKCQGLHGSVAQKSLRKRLAEDPIFRDKKNKQVRISLTKYRRKLKSEIIKKYGGKCMCCGEKEIIFLTIDHVNNDGNKERKTYHSYGTPFYSKLLKEEISERYQLLCRNCNWGKHVNGTCPHQKK